MRAVAVGEEGVCLVCEVLGVSHSHQCAIRITQHRRRWIGLVDLRTVQTSGCRVNDNEALLYQARKRSAHRTNRVAELERLQFFSVAVQLLVVPPVSARPATVSSR